MADPNSRRYCQGKGKAGPTSCRLGSCDYDCWGIAKLTEHSHNDGNTGRESGSAMVVQSMVNPIEEKFKEWTSGRRAVEARVSIFEKIRDIPYAVVPEINSARHYARMLAVGKGSCTPKHFLLREMYEKLGLAVLYVVYLFRWSDLEVAYPPWLRQLAETMPTSYHLACKVEIGGEFVLVDATVDSPLREIGLPVNENWDGASNMLLPVTPLGEEVIYHPSEVGAYQAQYDEASLQFFSQMNAWLDRVRKDAG